MPYTEPPPGEVLIKCNNVMPDLVPQLSIVDYQSEAYRRDSLDDADDVGSYNSDDEEIVSVIKARFFCF